MKIRKVEILQLDVENPVTFRDYDFAVKQGITLGDYTTIFSARMVDEKDSEDKEYLETLFYLFNYAMDDTPSALRDAIYHKGRSMTTSDVVGLNGKYYYCNDIGWKEMN